MSAIRARRYRHPARTTPETMNATRLKPESIIQSAFGFPPKSAVPKLVAPANPS